MLVSCRADETVNVNGVIWQDKGVFWGTETNHVKAGLHVRYSSNVTNRTLVQIMPVIYNGSASNDIAAYPVGGALLWLPPLPSRYQMELYSSNGIPVPKTWKGKMFGKRMDTNPKPLPILGAGRYFVEPGYLEFVAKLDETNQIVTYDPTVKLGLPASFVLQDMFRITEPGKYHLAFVVRALKRNGPSIYHDFEPCYLPVSVDIEIEKP
jgi:hypothetical protein